MISWVELASLAASSAELLAIALCATLIVYIIGYLNHGIQKIRRGAKYYLCDEELTYKQCKGFVFALEGIAFAFIFIIQLIVIIIALIIALRVVIGVDISQWIGTLGVVGIITLGIRSPLEEIFCGLINAWNAGAYDGMHLEVGGFKGTIWAYRLMNVVLISDENKKVFLYVPHSFLFQHVCQLSDDKSALVVNPQQAAKVIPKSIL
jgi:hypothetical protein